MGYIVNITDHERRQKMDEATLKEFLELKARAKEIGERIDLLTESIKAHGSGQVGNFVVAIETRQREQAPGVKVLRAEFGEAVEPFIKLVEYQTVKVVVA